MLKNIIGLLAGLLFGIGLLISGMTDPVKVQGFLDVFGAWDISLALVMGGGLAVAIVGVQLASAVNSAWLGHQLRSQPKLRLLKNSLMAQCYLVSAGVW